MLQWELWKMVEGTSRHLVFGGRAGMSLEKGLFPLCLLTRALSPSAWWFHTPQEGPIPDKGSAPGA